MANYVANCITPRVEARLIGKIYVPTGGLNPGNFVFAHTLDTNIAGNFEVFTATQPLTATLSGTMGAIVLNAPFEVYDSRRISGQADYTQYTYAAKEVAPIVFIEKHLMFEISTDTCSDVSTTPSSDIGKYLIPADQTNVLAVSSSASGVGSYLKIVGTRSFALAGNYGNTFTTVYICVAQ